MYNAQVANPKKNQSTNSTGTKWLLTSYGKVADQWSPRISLSQNWFIPLIVCLPKLIKGFFHSMYVIPGTDKYMHSSIFLFSFSLSLILGWWSAWSWLTAEHHMKYLIHYHVHHHSRHWPHGGCQHLSLVSYCDHQSCIEYLLNSWISLILHDEIFQILKIQFLIIIIKVNRQIAFKFII